MEDIRPQGRDEWLKLRAARLAKEQTPAVEKTVENSPGVKSDSMTLEEHQQRATERWLADRQAHEDQPDQARGLKQEKDIDRTKERGHGIDNDFGL